VVKYTIQDNFHSPSVDLCSKFGKKLIAGFQVLLICHTPDIFPRMGIIPVISQQDSLIAILYDPAVVRIYIVIILTVIFMITWRYEDRI